EDLIALLGRCVAQKADRRPATATALAEWKPPAPKPKPAAASPPPAPPPRPAPPPVPPTAGAPAAGDLYEVRCPDCATLLRVQGSMAGKNVRCPKCTKVFPLPTPGGSRPASPRAESTPRRRAAPPTTGPGWNGVKRR